MVVQTNERREVTKVEGFTLNHNTALTINGEVLAKIIKGEIECAKVETSRIKSDLLTKKMLNSPELKTFNFDFDKRLINSDFDIFIIFINVFIQLNFFFKIIL